MPGDAPGSGGAVEEKTSSLGSTNGVMSFKLLAYIFWCLSLRC